MEPVFHSKGNIFHGQNKWWLFIFVIIHVYSIKISLLLVSQSLFSETEGKMSSVLSDGLKAIEGHFVPEEAVTDVNQALQDPRGVDNAAFTRFEGIVSWYRDRCAFTYRFKWIFSSDDDKGLLPSNFAIYFIWISMYADASDKNKRGGDVNIKEKREKEKESQEKRKEK